MTDNPPPRPRIMPAVARIEKPPRTTRAQRQRQQRRIAAWLKPKGQR